MTCKEIQDGGGVSHILSIADDEDDYDTGYVRGYAASRRGQKINSTIYALNQNLRNGYLEGYRDYQDDAMRFHRDDAGMVD